MNTQRNSGLIAGLVVAILVAVLFFILWMSRGNEMKNLRGELESFKSSTTESTRRLEEDFRRARDEAAAGTRKAAELEKRMADERRQAEDSARLAENRHRSTLSMTEGRLAEATKELAELKKALSDRDEASAGEMENRLKAAEDAGNTLRERAEASEKSLADEQKRSETFRKRLLDLRGELIAAKRETAAAEKKAGTTAAGSAAASAAVSGMAAELDKAETAWREKTEALAGELAVSLDARQALARTEKRLREGSEALAKELAAAIDARQQSAREAAANNQRANSAEERLATLERELGNKAAELERAIRVRDGEWEKKLAEERSAFEKRLDEVLKKTTSTPAGKGRADAVKAAGADAVKAGADAVKGDADVASAIDAQFAAPGSAAARANHIFVNNPRMHLGQIIETLTDGVTFLIGVGSGQGMQPGTLLDVHRLDANGTKYVALIEVIDVLSDDFATARQLPEENPPLLCPVTGRAVRSETKVSPFVTTADGRPVALRSMAELGVVGDIPVAGDCIDLPR